VSEPAFDLELIQFLADGRNGLLTAFFLFWSFLGETEGYVLILVGIYVLYDKALAYRLSAVVLLAMCLNHALKTFIRNPRPFIDEGTWAEKWAVPAGNARELATEYSTPSGHAMSGSAFYMYLFASVKQRGVRIIAVLAIRSAAARRSTRLLRPGDPAMAASSQAARRPVRSRSGSRNTARTSRTDAKWRSAIPPKP